MVCPVLVVDAVVPRFPINLLGVGPSLLQGSVAPDVLARTDFAPRFTSCALGAILSLDRLVYLSGFLGLMLFKVFDFGRECNDLFLFLGDSFPIACKDAILKVAFHFCHEQFIHEQ